MKIAGDDPNEMSRMQQEAIRRVQEMQARAQRSLRQPASTPPRHPEPEPEPPERPVTKIPVPEHPVPGIGGIGNLNILDTLMKDSEKSLILVLILILVTEEADASLILALMYLIM